MMMGGDDTVARVHAAVAALGSAPWVLAVSGGADSMVLLDAAAATLPRESVTVATFDHGTGAHAAHAASLVRTVAADLGLACRVGHANAAGHTEAAWRSARWTFLREVAAAAHARIVTAHTRDDQVETVFMRVLRGAGPRGLAGLLAHSDIARPLVEIPRAVVRSYARSNEIGFVEDPTNEDRRHLRNRVRLDLLPAIEAVRPGFEADLLALSRRAADWRARMEAVALTFPLMTDSPGLHAFARAPFRGFAEPSLRVLWPALAARAGVVLDWRGTARLATFTIEGATGQQIQVAGGVRISMGRETITLHTAGARD